MALEIDEIGIRMRVDESRPAQQKKVEATRGGCNDVDREEIVQDCVKRVLKLLTNGRER